MIKNNKLAGRGLNYKVACEIKNKSNNLSDFTFFVASSHEVAAILKYRIPIFIALKKTIIKSNNKNSVRNF